MQIILFICNVTQKNSAMSKSKDAKKEVKKEATKTIKEKRAAKKDKKPKYDWYFTIREISDKIKKPARFASGRFFCLGNIETEQ